MAITPNSYKVAKTHKCLKLQDIFRERATNYRALLRKMTGRTAARRTDMPRAIRAAVPDGDQPSALMACGSVGAMRLAAARQR